MVTSGGNKSSSYLTEILRAEGLNEFANLKVADLTAATLAPYAWSCSATSRSPTRRSPR